MMPRMQRQRSAAGIAALDQYIYGVNVQYSVRDYGFSFQ